MPQWQTKTIARRCLVVWLLALAVPGPARAFAEDSCPLQGGWTECSLQACPSGNELLACESIAMATTVLFQQVTANAGGRRSNLHFDAAYYLAQAVGLAPRDAYLIAAYDQAVDTGGYVHRDQAGGLMADPADCLGEAPPPACALNTLVVGGLDRNNFVGGGLFFHFMAPLDGVAATGLSPQIAAPAQETLLHHVRRWVYGQGPLCVAALTEPVSAQDYAGGRRCYQTGLRESPRLLGRIPFITELGLAGYADWISPLGEQGVVTDPVSGEIAPASALESYLPPGQAAMARMGIYLHAVQDRVSHHRCNLASRIEGPRPLDAAPILSNPLMGPGYLFLQSQDPADLVGIFVGAEPLVDAEFFYEFSTAECDQLSHANRHVWEVGMEQDEIAEADRTTEASLRVAAEELRAFAQFYRLPARELPSDAVARLVTVLERPAAAERIAGFSGLAAEYGWLPLPGHGGLDSYADWDAKAGTYALAETSSEPGRPPAPVPGLPGAGGGGAFYSGLLLALAALRRRRVLALLPLGLLAAPAMAFDFSLGAVSGQAKLTLSSGLAVRTEPRATQFIGKTNVEGQQNLCPDDCLSFTGDPEPNQRLLAAEGGFFILNGDNGNLNYDQGEIVYASTKLRPELALTWGEWLFKASAIGIYDPVNEPFNEYHPNTLFQPAYTERPGRYSDDFALSLKPRELFVSGLLPLWSERELALSIGSQNLRWGEANTFLFSTLNQINPPDASLARMPGFMLSELPTPVPMALLSTDVAEGLSLDLVYMLGWRPVTPDPPGSFMSTSDVAGGGDHAIFTLGQFVEDPQGQNSLAFPASLATLTSATVGVFDEDYGYPTGGDEWGLKLGYYAEGLNNGTELGLYFLHYDSRLPYFSGYAGAESCARDSPDVVQALAACRGFAGSLDPLVPGEGLDPLPLDSARFFLDYPEGLNMSGFSFNTNFGSWAVAGELAYHHQLPVQVQIVDVAFTHLQPSFPRQDIHIGIDTLTDLVEQVPLAGDTLAQVTGLISDLSSGAVPQITLPAARHAVPDLLSVYRGVEIQPGQLIRGYERLDVAHLTVNGLKIVRDNPIGADQIIFLAEAGMTYVFDMPGPERLRFEGGGDNTHPSAGSDGSGDPSGAADPSRVNPTQMTKGFASQMAWGYRLLVRPSYSQVLGRYNILPTLLWQHDLQGTSPFPMQNFIEGRMNAWLLVDIELSRSLKLQAGYNAFFGADDRNLLVDRDNASLAVVLEF
ncbi:MAG: DUF1302 family protein [Stagnimonas sp.]|nr:DUF1302 family protein [Stagnimonas sp.]